MTDAALAEAKAALRTELRSRRQAFVVDLAHKATLLVDTLQLAEHAVPLLGDAKVVAAYLSTPLSIIHEVGQARPSLLFFIG